MGVLSILVQRKKSPQAELVDHRSLCHTGLIDIHAHVGTWAEVTEDINDANEYSEPFTPLMHALDSVDIRHFSFQHALEGGVTTVQTGPVVPMSLVAFGVFLKQQDLPLPLEF